MIDLRRGSTALAGCSVGWSVVPYKKRLQVWGVYGRHPIDVSLSLPFSPRPLSNQFKKNISSGEEEKKRRISTSAPGREGKRDISGQGRAG